MAQAWQVRGYERQKLLESLQQELWRDCERRGVRVEVFSLELAQAILLFLQYQIVGKEPVFVTTARVWQYFFHVIEYPVKKFSRTDAERQNLLGTFALKLVESGVQPFASELLRQEVHEQEKLYEGRRATDEVPVEG